MSAEHGHKPKKQDRETVRELLGRLSIVAGIVGLAAIALGRLAAKAYLGGSVLALVGGMFVSNWGEASRNPNKKSLFKRRKLAAADGGH